MYCLHMLVAILAMYEWIRFPPKQHGRCGNHVQKQIEDGRAKHILCEHNFGVRGRTQQRLPRWLTCMRHTTHTNDSLYMTESIQGAATILGTNYSQYLANYHQTWTKMSWLHMLIAFPIIVLCWDHVWCASGLIKHVPNVATMITR